MIHPHSSSNGSWCDEDLSSSEAAGWLLQQHLCLTQLLTLHAIAHVQTQQAQQHWVTAGSSS
jgi:hypothetical protein